MQILAEELKFPFQLTEVPDRPESMVTAFQNKAMAVVENADGFSLQFDRDEVSLEKIVELVDFERRSFPSMSFHLRIPPQAHTVWLDLSAPQALKNQILEQLHFLF